MAIVIILGKVHKKGNCWTSYVKTFAGIICDSGAASIKDCHVFVELGITKPNSKNHSEKDKGTCVSISWCE